MRLGYAVGSSACVPGVFTPLRLKNLYSDRDVLLVDGGVHDNQGTSSLLEQGCTVVLVSDASGQMDSQAHPSSGLVGVPLRSNSIMMSRVRQAQFRELAARQRSGRIRGLMFLHLKLDLDIESVDWIGEQSPEDPVKPDPITDYDLPKELQGKLANIRTDLDSFSDVEGFALMSSGYRMAKHEFGKSIKGVAKDTKRSLLAVSVDRPRHRSGSRCLRGRSEDTESREPCGSKDMGTVEDTPERRHCPCIACSHPARPPRHSIRGLFPADGWNGWFCARGNRGGSPSG